MAEESTPNPISIPSEHASSTFQTEEVLISTPIVQGPFTNTSSLDSTEKVGVEMVLGEAEVAQGREWAKERIERRLRGEYERAGSQLSDLVNDNLETPLRLNAIRVLGAKTTRTSFLSSLVAPFLPDLPHASYISSTPSSISTPPQTLRSILSTTRDVTNLFGKFDIFKQVDATLEATPGYLAETGDVDIVLRVRESGKYMLKTSTDIGDGEGTASATVRIRNAFGGAENVEGNAAFGTRTKSAFQLKIDKPINGSPITKADLSIFASQRDLNHFASCNEGSQGVQARVRTTRGPSYHELAYDAVLRRIWNVSPAASLSIRDAAGPTVKSALSYTFIRDTRDSPFIATKGSYVRFKQEYAGLGGDANFLKGELETSASRNLGGGYSMSLGLKSGILYPFGSKSSLFSDRFHLGGPTSVRMFRPSSMGPKDNGDYIGGDLHWSAGVSLLTPFPLKPEWPIKPHFFLNAGRLTSGTNLSIPEKVTSLISEPSVTAGIGFVYAHSLVRVEANFGVPLAMGEKEGGVKGLQFGLGMTFL